MQGFEGVPALGLHTSAFGALCLERGKGLGCGIADRGMDMDEDTGSLRSGTGAFCFPFQHIQDCLWEELSVPENPINVWLQWIQAQRQIPCLQTLQLISNGESPLSPKLAMPGYVLMNDSEILESFAQT